MKRTILLLTIVSLIAIPSFAKKEPGDVPAPAWEDPAVDIVDANIVFDWTDVAEAEKYSLCIEGLLEVDYTDDNDTPDNPDDDETFEDVEVEFSLCFGTSDRTDGGEMGDSDLSMPAEDFMMAILTAVDEAMLDQLGIGTDEADDIDWMELIAKVKGLDPHDKLDKKRQNNPFSDDLDLMDEF